MFSSFFTKLRKQKRVFSEIQYCIILKDVFDKTFVWKSKKVEG